MAEDEKTLKKININIKVKRSKLTQDLVKHIVFEVAKDRIRS